MGGPDTVGEAAPGPILCPSHQPRGQRVAFDEAADSNEAAWRFDRVGLESALVHRSVSERLSAEPDADRMGSAYPIQQP